MWYVRMQWLERVGKQLMEVKYDAKAFRDQSRAVEYIKGVAESWGYDDLDPSYDFSNGRVFNLEDGNRELRVSLLKSPEDEEKDFSWGMTVILSVNTGRKEETFVLHPATYKEREEAANAIRTLISLLPISEASLSILGSALKLKGKKYSLTVEVYSQDA